MNALEQVFSQNEEVQSVLTGINENLREQLVAGLSGSSRAMLISSFYKQTKQSVMVVTYNLLQAQKLYEDLTNFVSEEDVFLYPANELIAAELSVASPELKAQRIEALNHWAKDKQGIVVVPMGGFRKQLPPKSLWHAYQKQFTVGEEINLSQLLNDLIRMGFTRADMVSAPGEFSIRGGIIDLYPLTESKPIRIELFDTEIDSIRTFSIENQKSLEKVKTISISPATEVILEPEHLARMADLLEDGLRDSLKKVKKEKTKNLLLQNIGREVEKLRAGTITEETYKFSGLAYTKPASLLDYLPENGLVFLDEISRIQEVAATLEKEELEWFTNLLEEGEVIHDLPVAFSFQELISASKKKLVYLSLFLRHVPHTNPQNIINITCKQMQNFHGQMHLFKTELERWKKGKFSVVILGPDQERITKLRRVLDDYDIEAAELEESSKLLDGKVQIAQGNLHAGFELPLQKLAVVTEQELFNKKTKKKTRKSKISNAERIKNYSELKIGDYVVHVNHGVGKYLGIETLEINGVHKDYLNISYQGSDQLYVPVDQIELVQKYVASEGKEPKLYKLGGTDWKRVKSKVQSSVQDIADDLIKLYAEREASKGYGFSPDGEMQREFEAAFPYNETEDQLRSITEIKKDMEKERPMDRLLCGDVGYGKTEVAIRAAFKAVADGKQVAFLVPTTILAQQHFETMRERFQDYPVTLGILNRFRTRKEQNETMKGLKAGTIDIVVGTHRLLSKDVKYRDLGLLIIDEEQRFGVSHKEKIKQLKANVDVLTLTATPIPRTLHMSMLGVRDLSVIETPPENRFPVQTYVMEYNGMLVREAIERELARDGQVYFLYNRVEEIARKAEEISNLVPEARVAYAHGRMTEQELETVMLNFLEGEYDVLVSTTIIETGVDIPNVNTLIVHDADKMGLSQLYQLRGRVGRSNRVAYAYFTYRKDKVLTEVAEKRLQAIKEFTELGSGFKIAMRDLSIRGAGNLLGAEQHGFIDSVGFDLYSQMLKEAIDQKMLEKPASSQVQVEIDLQVDAYIPDSYIADGHQKIEMYKKFRGIAELSEVDELREEMVDRFGEYPVEVDYLFTIAIIKVHAMHADVESITQRKQEITILLSEDANIDGPKVSKLTNKVEKRSGLGMDGKRLKIILPIKNAPSSQWMITLEQLIEGLQHTKKDKVNQ